MELPLLDMDESEELIKYAIHHTKIVQDETNLKLNFADYIKKVKDPKLNQVPA
jgi:hypothetical protein